MDTPLALTLRSSRPVMRPKSMTTLLALPALAGLLLLGAPKAEAQCAPDAAFCAEVNVGAAFNARAQIRVRTARRQVVVHRAPAPRAAQVIIVAPAQPAPPPPPPMVQPPVVVVQTSVAPPPPPPPVATTVVVTAGPAQPQPVQQTTVRRERRPTNFGAHPQFAGVLGNDVSMGGFRMGFRFRPRNGHFALEVNGGFFTGSDYNGLNRSEFSFGLNTYFFFNPQHRVQFYGVLGIGGSTGHAEGYDRYTSEYRYDDGFGHFNGEGGLGLEWRISRWFALNVDVRGLIRHRFSGDGQAEFVERDEFGTPTGRETNASGGAIVNGGATFYF